MKRVGILCLALLGIFFSVSAQINTIIPKWVKVESLNTVGQINERDIKDGYYYVLVDEQYNVAEKHNFFHYATKVTSQSGSEIASQVEINYDPAYQKAYIHFIRIHRNGGVIDRTKSGEIRVLNEESRRSDGILDGMKTLYANLADVRNGDIVEYSYSIVGYNPVYQGHFSFDFWQAYSVPAGRLIYRTIIPPNVKANIQYKNGAVAPTLRQGSTTEYSWTIDNPRVINVESKAPAWYNPYPHAQISDFESWLDVKKWFTTLFKVKPYHDAELQQIADSIRKKYPGNTQAQISAAVDFTQQHIRYSGNENGIYSHTPHTPEYVIDNRYGDCKDKSLFLNELLRKLDVQAYPVLLNTSLKEHIVSETPSLKMFDHCVSAISYQGTLRYIDPTISYQRGQFIEKELPDYGTGLVLDSTQNIFDPMPSDRSSKLELVEDFMIDERTGDATLKVECTFTGASADQVRSYFATSSLNEIQESYQSIYSKYSNDVQIIDSVRYIDEASGEFRTVENYLLKNFWKPGNTGEGVSKDFLPFSLNERLVYPEDNRRKDPLKINFPAHVHQVLRVVKEGGWNISKAENTEHNKYFNYTQSILATDKMLILDYDYQSKVSYIAPADFLDYKSKMDFIDKHIVFTVGQKISTEDKADGLNWIMIITVLVSIGLSVFVCVQLSKKHFPNAFDTQYTSIGGWLVLVAIGLILTPVTLLVQIAGQLKDDLGNNFFFYMLDSKSAYYQPLRAYYVIGMYAFNIFLLVSSVFLIILFFQKRNAFRVYYCAYRLFNVVLLVIDLIILTCITGDDASVEERNLIASETSGLVRTAIQACIWIPYIWYSQRSRHTFTSENPPPVLDGAPNTMEDPEPVA